MEKIWENISGSLIPFNKLCTVPMGAKQSKQVSYKYEIANSLGEIALIWSFFSGLSTPYIRKHKPKSQGRSWKVSKRIQDIRYIVRRHVRSTIHVKECLCSLKLIIRLTCMSTRIATNTLGTKLSNSLVKISDSKIVKTCEDQSPVLWKVFTA